jgi:hypothetical protein
MYTYYILPMYTLDTRSIFSDGFFTYIAERQGFRAYWEVQYSGSVFKVGKIMINLNNCLR